MSVGSAHCYCRFHVCASPRLPPQTARARPDRPYYLHNVRHEQPSQDELTRPRAQPPPPTRVLLPQVRVRVRVRVRGVRGVRDRLPVRTAPPPQQPRAARDREPRTRSARRGLTTPNLTCCSPSLLNQPETLTPRLIRSNLYVLRSLFARLRAYRARPAAAKAAALPPGRHLSNGPAPPLKVGKKVQVFPLPLLSSCSSACETKTTPAEQQRQRSATTPNLSARTPVVPVVPVVWWAGQGGGSSNSFQHLHSRSTCTAEARAEQEQQQ